MRWSTRAARLRWPVGTARRCWRGIWAGILAHRLASDANGIHLGSGMVAGIRVDLIDDEDVATDFAVVSSSEKRKKTFVFLTWVPIRCWAQWGRPVGWCLGCPTGCCWASAWPGKLVRFFSPFLFLFSFFYFQFCFINQI
jgi:hypothetical protein